MIKKNLPATALTLFVLLIAGPTAQAQRYPDSDPRSPNFQQWNPQQNEQAQQRQRSQEAAEKQRAEESARIFGEGLSTFMENQRRLQEKISNDVERDRALFLKTLPLLDKLGTVGVNQVRAMSDVRFKEAAIEGKVPNTNNLRIDLRGSACDDPRIKATMYDFDADGMLQSITYVWERPAGPAPAPIFQERAKTLSILHSGLPQPQSPGRLQADTSLGRLVLQDMPERNLLLEAYAKKK